MIVRALLMLALLSSLAPVLATRVVNEGVSAQSRPNFVVIVVDDLDTGSVARMPVVQRELARNGATLTRFFASTPLCCPSRVSLLRGQYAHNHGVLRNTGEDAGFAAFHQSGNEVETLATVLDDADYETALIGKYLNGYSMNGEARTFIPPGWDFWVAGVDHAAYNGFNYDVNVNGEIAHHGRGEQDYLTDVLSGHAQAFLASATGAGRPFLLYLAPYAAHSPATPAPRHKGTLRGATAPRTPAFNERNVRDKPSWVRSTGRLSDAKIARIDHDYQRRLESLLAVDEMVEAVVNQLDASGVMESTYILFLSDNGYFMGEHRQPHGKDAPYDSASRVPMIVRGPGVPADTSVGQLALNIDVAPTIIELAGLNTPSFADGRSLAPILAGEKRDWRKTVLLEGFGKETEFLEGSETSTPPFRALRTEDALYVEYETGESELYALRKDPHQLENRAASAPNALLREYARHLEALVGCSGSDCRQLEDEPPPRRGDGSAARSEGRRRDVSSELRRGKEADDTQAAAEPSEVQSLRVDSDVGSTATLAFQMTPREARAGSLHLRVHVVSVERPGTLVAMLEPEAARAGNSERHRERLDGARVSESGWIALDVSGALGDSRTLLVGLHGRDGASMIVSSPASADLPSLEIGRAVDENGQGNGRNTRRQAAERQRSDQAQRGGRRS